jgi:hypothetical protein
MHWYDRQHVEHEIFGQRGVDLVPHKILKIIGWIELFVALPLFYLLVGFIRTVYWPEDPTPWHGELAWLGMSIAAVLFSLFALPGLAAVCAWPRAWWWQSLAALGLFSMDFIVVSFLR